MDAADRKYYSENEELLLPRVVKNYIQVFEMEMEGK